MDSHFDNSPDKGGSGFWTFILVFLIVLGILYFVNLSNSNSGSSDYWEIRISHTSNGIEIKKYDYDEIMNDALEKVKEIMGENY